MKPNDIRAELVRNSVKIKDIASQVGSAGPNVSEVIKGLRKTARIRQAIAEAINRPVEEVFPPQEAA